MTELPVLIIFISYSLSRHLYPQYSKFNLLIFILKVMLATNKRNADGSFDSQTKEVWHHTGEFIWGLDL